jgi:hypothetical protein
MPKAVKPTDADILIRFGGGLHTRPSAQDIQDGEAADGQNFLLNVDNGQLRNRPPFDLIGTVPNAAEIRGGASLLETDGTVTALFQAGNTVYEWDGLTTFTSRGTVSSSAKLRGHWDTSCWQLDDLVLISDLNLSETVLQWDGTSLDPVVFVDESGVTFGNFYAKYIGVSNERAYFAHTRDATTNKHMIVGSEQSDYTVISVNNVPSSGLSLSDPFFLLAPDLKPINGLVQAFGTTIISTEKGRLFNLAGADASEFSFTDFYAGSAATGDEAVAYIGNDVLYGRLGRVESLKDTNKFGDSEASDVTAMISDQFEDTDGWTIVYNSRLNRVYAFPTGSSEVWVFDNAMLGGKLSPWMKWNTRHSMAFQPTFVMSMLDPVDGLEYVFMGDANGNVYRMEGTGIAGDGGSEAVSMEWLSKIYSMPLSAQAYGVEGYIKYRRNERCTVQITFEFAGESAYDETIFLELPTVPGGIYYGNSQYYGGSFYYGTISGRVSRQPFMAPGQATEFQVRVVVSDVVDFQIDEIGLRFEASSQ